MGHTIVFVVDGEAQAEGGLFETNVLERHIEVFAGLAEVGLGLLAHLLLGFNLHLDIAEHHIARCLELGLALAELCQRQVFEILLHVLLAVVAFEEGHHLGVFIGSLEHRSTVEHQRSLVGVLLRDDVVEFLDGVAHTSLGVEIEAELVGTATEGVDLVQREHTLLFALELDSLVYQGAMVDGVVVGIVIETILEDRHHEEVFLGLVLKGNLEEAARHTAIVAAVAGHGVHPMLDGHRHALEGDALGATEGMTACAECHLLQKFGIIDRDLGQLLVVEGYEYSLVVFSKAHEIIERVEGIGFLLS